MQALETGKLPMDLLAALLARYGGQDERLVVGPRVGEDAAVLDMGQRYLVVKSDPITFATDQIGWYVVHVNANDIAAMGAAPRWLLLTLLLPEQGSTPDLVEAIFAQVDDACRELGVVLCGGHTEISYGLERPIAVGLMLGEVEKEDLVCSGGSRVGDDLILTKGIAIEGTSLLARELAGPLTERVGAAAVARGQRFLQEPGISVVRDAQVVCHAARPHAMHDPTEGGLSTGLWELAHAAGLGIEIDLDRVRVYAETLAFCQALGLDPLGLIASGALLVVAAPDDTAAILAALDGAGIDAGVIGRVVAGPPAVQVRTAGGQVPLPTFARDELTRVFAQSSGTI
jgi:hydrogenase expression/formation protein HypE